MIQSIYNPYLLHITKDNTIFSIIKFQTNNILIIANKEFTNHKQIELKNTKFIIKEYKTLISNILFKFNKDLIIQYKNKSIYLNQ